MYKQESSYREITEQTERMSGGRQRHSFTPLFIFFFIYTQVYNVADGLEIVSRSRWGAQSPRHITPLRTPVSRVVIHHTATPTCSSISACSSRVRNIQHDHRNLKNPPWDDIGYNFLIGGDGSVYEGRGWDRQGAHARGYNRVSIGIAFIGNFRYATPTTGALNAARELIARGKSQNKISRSYNLYGHRQLGSTQCPGNSLYGIVQTLKV